MTASVPLIGRARELEKVLQATARAKAGHGSVLLIEGEAGIGKSRLLAEGLQGASEQGLKVLVGAARELEAERPFGAVSDALHLSYQPDDPDLLRVRDLLFGKEDVGEIRFRIVDLLGDLFERWTQESAVLLALEDLHWADGSTLLVLDRLGRLAPTLPLLIVGTARPSPRSRELAITLDEIAPQLVRLEPLTAEERIDLATEVLQARPGESLQAKLEASGGNPLFETELLAALREEGAITVEKGVAEAEARELPSLGLTILRRLGFLPTETLEVLRLASVLGSAFSVEHLSLLADRSAGELVRVLDPALRAEIVLEQDERLAFRHDLVRDAVYEDLPLAMRRELHRQAGRALLATGAPAVEAAHQVALGASVGDEEAIAVLIEAARQAATRAPASAAEFLTRALELAPEGYARRSEILADLALNLVWLSRLADAEAYAGEALADPRVDQATALRAHSGLIWALAGQGRDRDAIEQMSRFLDLFPIPTLQRAEFVLGRGIARLYAVDLAGARGDLEEGRRLLQNDSGDPGTESLMNLEGSLLFFTGHAREGLQALDGAAEIANRTGVHMDILDTRGRRAATLMLLDRFDDARQEFRDLVGYAERFGLTRAAGVAETGLARISVASGAWDEMEVEIETAEALAGGAGDQGLILRNAYCRALVAFHRNDTRAARAEIAKAEPQLTVRRPVYIAQGMGAIRGLLEDAAGRTGDALSVFEEIRRVYEGYLYEVPFWAPDAVRIAIAAGDRHSAHRFAAVAEEAAEAIGTSSAKSAALRCRGLAQEDGTLLMDAVEVGRPSPRPVERALTLEDAARLRSSKKEAVALLEEALEILDGLGAERHSRRVRAALRERGVQRGPSRRTRATFGWEALTDGERRVIDLVAEGLRNRQIAERLFVSVRTVETHISRALNKVGATSRVELAALALEARGATEQ